MLTVAVALYSKCGLVLSMGRRARMVVPLTTGNMTTDGSPDCYTCPHWFDSQSKLQLQTERKTRGRYTGRVPETIQPCSSQWSRDCILTDASGHQSNGMNGHNENQSERVLVQVSKAIDTHCLGSSFLSIYAHSLYSILRTPRRRESYPSQY
jgi:hypothetical protein